MNKEAVFVIFDMVNETWDVMNYDRECIFFGNAFEVDDWLDANDDKYYECDDRELMPIACCEHQES